MKLEFLESSVFSDSETLFKCKNWWSKCLQEIVLVHHFIVPFIPIQMTLAYIELEQCSTWTW